MAIFQWSGSIQFGAFVSIPVRIKAAVKEETLAFQMLHDGCNGQLGYAQDWYCKARESDACGAPDEVISRSSSVKGWTGKPVDVAQLDALKAAKSKLIDLDGLVPAEQIDPRYYAQSYDVTPEEGGEKSYVLLLKLLERSNRVAIGKAAFGDQESIVTIRPRDGVLALELMYWPEDLTRAGRDAAAREIVAHVKVTEPELQLGDKLVEFMSKDFDPSAYKNEVAENIKAYLKTVEDGEAAPPVPKSVEAAGGGLDLLAALQASIDASTEAKKEPAIVAKSA